MSDNARVKVWVCRFCRRMERWRSKPPADTRSGANGKAKRLPWVTDAATRPATHVCPSCAPTKGFHND